jgi:hypothetical protein
MKTHIDSEAPVRRHDFGTDHLNEQFDRDVKVLTAGLEGVSGNGDRYVLAVDSYAREYRQRLDYFAAVVTGQVVEKG